MVRFEELQELWQTQPQAELAALAAESRGMAAALRRFRRRQYVIHGIKLAVITWLTWFFLSRPGVTAVTVLGFGLVLAGMIHAMVTDWRIQSAIAHLDFTRPSAGFVDATLARLRDPNAPFRRAGWLFIALLAAGVNVMMLDAPMAAQRLTSHAAATLLPFAAFAVALKVRAKRYAMEYKPLVERLAAIKAALEEHAE